MSRSEHHRAQRDYFDSADAAHFAWQTGAPYIAASEAALLDGLSLFAGERLLEIGCGEGGNLHHLARRFPSARLYGTDFSAAKAGFARRSTSALTACADATQLPFADGSFDAVLIRDLLHHLAAADRVGALVEARRVLRPGGRLLLVEPNGRSPLVLLQAATVAAERGVLRSTGRRLGGELAAAGFADVTIERRQPLPLSRILLHPTLGSPALGSVGVVARTLAALERASAALPTALWAYLLCHGRRP